MNEQRYRDYDSFAWLYNKHWAKEYHEQAMPVLDRLLLGRLAGGSAVLDLCCGDGRLAKALAGRGYRVTGVDGSEEMLASGRRRAPEVTFVAADARHFAFNEPFDAVVSTGDSMNHLLSRPELKKVFRNVVECLRPGGWFAFDLNKLEGFRDLWPNVTSIVDVDVVSVARANYDEGRKLATCDFTQFRRVDGNWLRSDFTIRERYYPEDEVMADLREVGFADVACYDAVELGMKGEIGQHRSYLLGRRGLAF